MNLARWLSRLWNILPCKLGWHDPVQSSIMSRHSTGEFAWFCRRCGDFLGYGNIWPPHPLPCPDPQDAHPGKERPAA